MSDARVTRYKKAASLRFFFLPLVVGFFFFLTLATMYRCFVEVKRKKNEFQVCVLFYRVFFIPARRCCAVHSGSVYYDDDYHYTVVLSHSHSVFFSSFSLQI